MKFILSHSRRYLLELYTQREACFSWLCMNVGRVEMGFGCQDASLSSLLFVWEEKTIYLFHKSHVSKHTFLLIYVSFSNLHNPIKTAALAQFGLNFTLDFCKQMTQLSGFFYLMVFLVVSVFNNVKRLITAPTPLCFTRRSRQANVSCHRNMACCGRKRQTLALMCTMWWRMRGLWCFSCCLLHVESAVFWIFVLKQ